MSLIPENLVVITDGQDKGSVGVVTRRPGYSTDQVDIGGALVTKAKSQYRPLRLGDIVAI